MDKQLTPQLRFSEFEDNWKKIKLSELIDFKSGYAFKSSKMLNKGNFQIIKMSNVYKNKFRLDRNSSFINTVDSKQQEFFLKKGDNLLTLTGTVGKTDYGYSISIPENNKFLLNQRLVRLRSIENKSHNNFISSILKTSKFLHNFFAESKGGTGNQSNVSVDDVKNIKLYFPILKEQQKIASFLTDVDTKITQLTKKKTLLEQYKKGVMQKIFNQELRFKDDNGNDFPDWEEKTLGDVCYKKSSNISANSLSKNIGDYKIYGATGFLQYVDFYDEENEFIGIVKDGSGVGNCYLINKFSSVLGTLDKIIPKDFTNIYFLYCMLQRIDFKKYKVGSSIPHIYFKDYSNKKIQLPCLKEQEKMANFLIDIDIKIETLNTQIEHSRTFKKGLLQQMFV